MSLSRSMWFHSTSFALSRECLFLMVLNCFNVYVLPHVTLCGPLRVYIFSLCIRMHVESTADTMLG